MMVLSVAFDITRLATRVLNLTPNGIDRIDFAFARHFLDPARQDRLAIMMTLLGPRAIAAAAARDIVDGISIHWGEDDRSEHDECYRQITAWIRGEAAPSSAVRRVARGRPLAHPEFYDGSARTAFPSAAHLPPLCRSGRAISTSVNSRSGSRAISPG
jgi:hypothetical protein